MLVAPHVKRKFFALCDRSGGPNACHPWVGGKPDPTSGYGQVNWIELGGKRRVHVVAWELANDQEVPRHPDTGRKLDVDHLCHNRAKRCPGGKLCKHRLCCNPRHLVPKLPQENKDAADEPRARGRFRTYFDCGCEITEENTYTITRKGTRHGKPRAPERRCRKHERLKQARAREVSAPLAGK
jgi:hypothetical protein